MTPRDFSLFPKVKMLKGNRFKDKEEIKQNEMTQLLAIPKSQFQKCFKLLEQVCGLSNGLL
jgi:hypothetical protein